MTIKRQDLERLKRFAKQAEANAQRLRQAARRAGEDARRLRAVPIKRRAS